MSIYYCRTCGFYHSNTGRCSRCQRGELRKVRGDQEFKC